MVVVYWLPSVGIGAAKSPPPVLPGPQTVIVPLTDILKFKWPDGTPQIDVVNLWGAAFTSGSVFEPPYLQFDTNLQQILSNGTYKALQAAGIKVVLSITGGNGTFGWSSIPAEQIQNFANYLNTVMLDPDMGFGLDGIDIDDEYAAGGNTLTQTVATMRNTFPSGKIISKALGGGDTTPDSEVAQYLNYGAIMTYGDSPVMLESWFNAYVGAGFQNEQLLIGVNAGPTDGPGNFTSVETTQTVALWQPEDGTKLGMMLWSFSQDIQQFTASPQNQVSLKFPNAGDHEWLNAIVNATSKNQILNSKFQIPNH